MTAEDTFFWNDAFGEENNQSVLFVSQALFIKNIG